MAEIPDDDHSKAQRFARPIGRFMARWRERIRKRPWLNVIYRVLISLLGGLIVIIGLILVPLPGPGWLIVFIGMTVLGAEYHWARRLTSWLRMTLARFAERWKLWRARRATRAAARKRDAERRSAVSTPVPHSETARPREEPSRSEVPELVTSPSEY